MAAPIRYANPLAQSYKSALEMQELYLAAQCKGVANKSPPIASISAPLSIKYFATAK
jgi:hypothetical protein